MELQRQTAQSLSERMVGVIALCCTRGHWAIENSLHWILDVVMHEDGARNRKDNSAENFAIIRHLALNLMQNDPSVKLSKKQMKKNSNGTTVMPCRWYLAIFSLTICSYKRTVSFQDCPA